MIDDDKIAGATVIIARKGKIAYFQTLGMMDKKANKPMQKDTVCRFYSMSKPITSVAVMMLYEAGKIDLDTPVQRYIPEFKRLKVYVKDGKNARQDRKMTVRDLLRHTSGLTYGFFGNTDVDKMYRAQGVLDKNSSLTEMAAKLGKIPLMFQPGTKWHYGVSTDMLGCLVENVSGQTLDEFFQQRIFAPLDMKDTEFFVRPENAARFASCYGPDGNGGLKVSDDAADSNFLKKPRLLSGGGGLVSTARDYMRFAQMLLNKGELYGTRLLKTETVEMMTSNQLPDSVTRGPGNGFGLGFSVKLTDGETPKGEYGWSGAASTHFWISPKHDLIAITLTQYMPFQNRVPGTVKPIIYDAIEAASGQSTEKISSMSRE
jgi:CubicO group peptidase (beta-lactamase class C family)